MGKEMTDKKPLTPEETRTPIQDALYATNRFTPDQCDLLTDGILQYINDADMQIVKNNYPHGLYSSKDINLSILHERERLISEIRGKVEEASYEDDQFEKRVNYDAIIQILNDLK